MEDDVFEKMEAFINNEMTVEEKQRFENELANDDKLAQRFQLYKKIQDTLSASQLNKENETSLQQTIVQVNNEHASRPAKVVTFSKANRWYAVAAAVLAVIVSVYLFNNDKKSNTELYAQYAVFPALSGTRGSNDSLLSKAITYYNNKQFTQAKPLLQQSLATDSSDKEIQLAYYICALQTENLGEALKGFTNIAATENVFTYQAKWYMALTYLKQNNIDACKLILQQIPADADTYTKAQQLLKQLD